MLMLPNDFYIIKGVSSLSLIRAATDGFGLSKLRVWLSQGRKFTLIHHFHPELAKMMHFLFFSHVAPVIY